MEPRASTPGTLMGPMTSSTVSELLGHIPALEDWVFTVSPGSAPEHCLQGQRLPGDDFRRSSQLFASRSHPQAGRAAQQAGMSKQSPLSAPSSGVSTGKPRGCSCRPGTRCEHTPTLLELAVTRLCGEGGVMLIPEPRAAGRRRTVWCVEPARHRALCVASVQEMPLLL